MISWKWLPFDALSTADLYAVLQCRQQVFIQEQNCLYGDIDGRDQDAWHLLGWQDGATGPELVAYCRYFAPGVRYPEASLGRVLCMPAVRQQRVGQALLRQALLCADQLHPGQRFRIAAQQYLESFYGGFGFMPTGDPYLEDDILHIDMLLAT